MGIVESNQGRRNFFIDSRSSPDRYSNELNPEKKDYTGLKGGILKPFEFAKFFRNDDCSLMEDVNMIDLNSKKSFVLRCNKI